MEIRLFTDGAARGNPGPAGIGAVLVGPGGEELKTISEYIGEGTNNFAEYTALIRGLEEAERLGANRVAVFLDSELVARQLVGAYRVKSESLRPLYRQARELISRLDARVSHIPREKNKRADELANEAIDLGYGPEAPLTGGQAQEGSPGEKSFAGSEVRSGQPSLF